MKRDPDVLVIGGGAIGVCSAYYLALQGLRVSIVEKGEVASGCSGANAGLIVPSYIIPLAKPGALSKGLKLMFEPESPFYIKPRFDPSLFYWLRQFRKACRPQQMRNGVGLLRELNYASLELFNHLITDESPTCNYQQDGWLMVYKTDEGFEDALREARILESYNVELKILSADETLEMEPTISTKISGGIYFPEDAHLDPEKFLQSLAERLKERGVIVCEQTEVLGIETSHEHIKAVHTNQGDFQPQQVVLASGAWSPRLLRSLGLKLPVQPAKGYSISIKRPEQCPSVPLYLSESKVAVAPLGDSLRFAGTLELAGLDVGINSRRVGAIMSAVEDYLGLTESLDTADVRCGLRPCSPDGLPIVGRMPVFKDILVATGHGMLGLTLAPITGKLVSQLAGEQAPDIDLRLLSATRFR